MSGNNECCGGFWDWLSTFKLRNQFMFLLSVPLLICVILTVVINIVIVTQTGNNIRDDGTSAMTDQNARITTNTISEQSTLLTSRLNAYSSGVVTLLRENYKKMRDPNYPFGSGESYYSFDPLPPLTQYLGIMASFGASSFHVPGLVAGSVQGFSGQINQTRDHSWHLDRMMKMMTGLNPMIVGVYAGFEANGEFRIFPGQATPTAYDPRARGWYQCAKDLEGMCITEPYQDALSKQWMITFAVRYVENGNIVGVFGADVLISGIRESISDLSFYDTGKATLFEVSGTVVADRECPMQILDEVICTYQSLEVPSVSQSTWNSIGALGVGASTSVEAGGYLITASRLEQWPQYILAVFIPKGAVTAPMENVRSEISDTQKDITITLIIVLVVAIVVSIGFTWGMAWYVARPVDNAKKMFENMQNQIGTGHRLTEIDRVNSGVGAEGTEFARNANSWLQSVIDAGGVVVNDSLEAVLPSYEQAILNNFSTGSRSGSSSSSGASSYGMTSRKGSTGSYTNSNADASAKRTWESSDTASDVTSTS